MTKPIAPALAFIGAGNMASSLIGGWCAYCERQDLTPVVTVADTSESQLQKVAERFGVATTVSNTDAVKKADIAIIAVKPNLVETVCRDIGAALDDGTTVLSVAAGVRLQDMQRWLGNSQQDSDQSRALIRSMPNTPALFGAGITGMYANSSCTETVRAQAEQVMQAAGKVVQVDDETLLDAVTAVSGSGPAYFFYLIECMAANGEQLGLSKEAALELAIETAYGAALMARESDIDAATLRANVTSKGGTTAAALDSFQSDDFAATIQRGMQAARDRAISLGEEFGSS